MPKHWKHAPWGQAPQFFMEIHLNQYQGPLKAKIYILVFLVVLYDTILCIFYGQTKFYISIDPFYCKSFLMVVAYHSCFSLTHILLLTIL